MNRKQLRILVLSSYFRPHTGGSQRYMEELYAHVRKLDPSISVDVLAYNTEHAKAKELVRGLTVYRVPGFEILRGQFVLPNPIALLSQLYSLSKNNYDIVHAHVRFFDVTWWGWLFARAIGAKSIVTCHVASHPVHEHIAIRLIARLVDMTLGKWSVGRYNLVTVTNEAAKQFLRKNLHIKNDISLISGGVDTSWYAPSKGKTRNIPRVNKEFTHRDIIITYAGRMIWSKGVTYFYDAILKLNNILPKHVYFVLAGPGKLGDEIRTDIQEKGHDTRIFAVGNLSDREVKKLLSCTDIFVHPSHHNEGFPNSILEAGASETYVIATDNAGTGEIVTDNVTGVFIRQKDSQDIIRNIKAAIGKTKKRKTAAKALRRHIQKTYDWKIIARTHISLVRYIYNESPYHRWLRLHRLNNKHLPA